MIIPIRVLIADDHPVFRYGLRALLNAEPSTELVGEVERGDEVPEVCERTDPQVVLMDLTMPGLDGITATRAVLAQNADIGILVLTMQEDDRSLMRALSAGARGYLVKGATTDEIVDAIRTVASGGIVIGAAMANRALRRFDEVSLGTHAYPFPALTNREREVLRLLARGQTNNAIAEALFLSPKTVRNHISPVFSKLDVRDRAEAIVRAHDAGIGNSSTD